LRNDPDELVNFHNNEKYKDIVHTLEAELFVAMKKYKVSLADKKVVFFDRPVCKDTKDQIPSFPDRVCEDLLKKGHEKECQWDEVSNSCPSACGICCKDTRGEVRYNGKLITCDDVAFRKGNRCNSPGIAEFCPVTCLKCIPVLPSTNPSYSPTLEHSLIPSRGPSAAPIPEPSARPSSTPSSSSSSSTSSSTTPSYMPTLEPNSIQTIAPSVHPSAAPSNIPTNKLSSIASSDSTVTPSTSPSAAPSYIPTNELSSMPSTESTVVSSTSPSTSLSTMKRPSSSAVPSHYQTFEPSSIPSKHQTSLPTAKPSSVSSSDPSYKPTIKSSLIPSKSPSIPPSRPNTSQPQLITCVDNSTFYADFQYRTCAWINLVQTRKEKQCKKPEVRFACPSSCGIC